MVSKNRTSKEITQIRRMTGYNVISEHFVLSMIIVVSMCLGLFILNTIEALYNIPIDTSTQVYSRPERLFITLICLVGALFHINYARVLYCYTRKELVRYCIYAFAFIFVFVHFSTIIFPAIIQFFVYHCSN